MSEQTHNQKLGGYKLVRHPNMPYRKIISRPDGTLIPRAEDEVYELNTLLNRFNELQEDLDNLNELYEFVCSFKGGVK